MTPVGLRIQNALNAEYQSLLRTKITPWAFMKTDVGLSIDGCRGEKICYKGIRFEGSPQNVFWSFVDPCIDDIITQTFESAFEQAKSLPASILTSLEETKGLLSSFVVKLFQEMVTIDRRLRGDGFPDKVLPYDASHHVMRWKSAIEDQYRSYRSAHEKLERNEYSGKALGTILGWLENTSIFVFLRRNGTPVSLIVAALIALIGWIVAAIKWYH